MSNLGSYQLMTTAAKKVGGVENLVALIAFAGYGAGKLIEYCVQNYKEKKILLEESNNQIYEVKNYGVSNEDLEFNVGDMYKVLEIVEDSDAVLIEKIDDDNNPYTVSAELLSKISDFTI